MCGDLALNSSKFLLLINVIILSERIPQHGSVLELDWSGSGSRSDVNFIVNVLLLMLLFP